VQQTGAGWRGNEYFFDAIVTYTKEHIPLMIIAGKAYGIGSCRGLAATGTLRLGEYGGVG
jgi:aconitase A